MSARLTVTLKLATSLDGRIATSSGESKWITGEAARAEVHRMRAVHDAILVGGETARADDPELTVRSDPPAPRAPVRVVLDSRLRLSPDSRLARTTDVAPVLVFAARDSDPAARKALEARGIRVRTVPRSIEGVDVPAVIAALGEEGVSSLLVEGGGTVAATFLRAGLVDRLEWFRAPVILGAESRPAVGATALEALSRASRFRRLEVRELGPDLWERYGRS